MAKGKPIMIAGSYGSGKIFMAGHPTFYSQTNNNLILLKNTIKWMNKNNRITVSLGLLFS